jgi:quercetin dioxygenase-like cupin family protein
MRVCCSTGLAKQARQISYATVMVALLTAGCGGGSSTTPADSAASTAATAAASAGAAPATAATAAAPSGEVTLPPGFPDRPFVRVKFDELTWRPTEGNTLGVQTAVVEGDPSKPGYYLTINHFPAGVMSRPHYHPDERYVIVLRGTWYTDEGEVFRPNQAVALKPGDFMRHPKGGPHYDGALNEDTWVAISGYGPTKATVMDGGELFGKSR